MTEIKYIVKSIAIITVLYFVFWLPQFVNILSNNKEAVEFRKNGVSITIIQRMKPHLMKTNLISLLLKPGKIIKQNAVTKRPLSIPQNN